MLAGFTGTPILNEPSEGRQLLDIIKGLGAVLACVCILGLFPMSLFASVLMSRTRSLLGHIQNHDDKPRRFDTMGEIARQASYLLVLGLSLQQIFYDTGLCIGVAVALSSAGCILPLIFIRRLQDSVWMCFFNLLLIIAAITIALVAIGLAEDRRPQCDDDGDYFFFPKELGLSVALGSATNVALMI